MLLIKPGLNAREPGETFPSRWLSLNINARFVRSLFFTTLCVVSGGAGANTAYANPSIENFSVVQSLYARGNAAAYRIELPPTVFENTRNPYHEIAVFNARGNRVPSWLEPGNEAPEPDDLHWRRVEVNPLENGSGYLVDTGGSFILSQLKVTSRIDNTVASLDLFSSVASTGPWHFERHANLVQLNHQGQQIDDTVVYLGRLEKRYLKLDFAEGNAGFKTQPPLVDVKFAPLDLIFLRHGEGPFSLAFGYPDSPAERLVQEPSAQKPSRQFQSREVVPGELHWQAPVAVSEPSQESSWDYARMAFWLSLSVFVVVMLGVAVWLFKDLRRHPEPSIDKGDRS
ncbi:MAG: DUF3999 family protein [Hahellaceae bacterium]|nr:DUF3999 family protein [Hahellaceae bacterium]MCP5168973.1 DUF3999 family protein [Hahellaceae bacterium]